MKNLGVNIDHIATIRNARGEKHPDPYFAAKKSIHYGADSITIHLREDRRHIIDKDVNKISSSKLIPLNLEIASNSKVKRVIVISSNSPIGCNIDNNHLSFDNQINKVVSSCNTTITDICKIKNFLGYEQ